MNGLNWYTDNKLAFFHFFTRLQIPARFRACKSVCASFSKCDTYRPKCLIKVHGSIFMVSPEFSCYFTGFRYYFVISLRKFSQFTKTHWTLLIPITKFPEHRIYFLKVARVVSLKLVFTDLFLDNLVILIKLCKIRYLN